MFTGAIAMEQIPIKVKCYSGYKADESPRSFIWDNIEFEIVEIIDRWHEAYDKLTSQGINYYKVKTNLAGRYMIKHELDHDCWFLVV
jgi:hypothetical protein